MIVDSIPVVLWSLILGLHLATQNSDLPKAYLRYLPRTLAVLWIVSLTIAFSRLAGNAVGFYGGRVTGAQSVTSLTRKLAQLAVVAFGLAWLLRVFDVTLTPILTTLGVGGLAVALALQDTLSNLFGGIYVSMAGQVRLGDYIKLNTGEEGYVTDIGWRSTVIRTLGGNLIKQRDIRWRHHVVKAFAVIGNERVPVDQAADAVGDAVGDAGDDHAAIAVADEDNVFQIILDQIIGNGFDGLGEAAGFLVARFVAGDGRGVNLMTGRADRGRGRFELFAGVPGTVNKHVGRHVNLLPEVVLFMNVILVAGSCDIRRPQGNMAGAGGQRACVVRCAF